MAWNEVNPGVERTVTLYSSVASSPPVILYQKPSRTSAALRTVDHSRADSRGCERPHLVGVAGVVAPVELDGVGLAGFGHPAIDLDLDGTRPGRLSTVALPSLGLIISRAVRGATRVPASKGAKRAPEERAELARPIEDEQDDDQPGHARRDAADDAVLQARSLTALSMSARATSLGGPVVDGAADDRSELLVVEIDPVDDAVLGAGQRFLDLAGGEIGIDAPRQRPDHGPAQVERRRHEIADQRQLPQARGQVPGPIDEHHEHGIGEGAGDEAENRGGEVEQTDGPFGAFKNPPFSGNSGSGTSRPQAMT